SVILSQVVNFVLASQKLRVYGRQKATCSVSLVPHCEERRSDHSWEYYRAEAHCCLRSSLTMLRREFPAVLLSSVRGRLRESRRRKQPTTRVPRHPLSQCYRSAFRPTLSWR